MTLVNPELIQLVQAAQAGNKDAFNQLVQRFQNMVYATAFALVGDAVTAQDAAQEAFIDAYLSLPNLREPVAFPGWLRRVVIKHCDRQTRRKPAKSVPLDQLFDLRAPQPDPAMAIEEAFFRQTIHALIDRLTPAQRIVTLLFYVEGYSQQEVADYLEISVTAVKKRLFNARETLKERISLMIDQDFVDNRPALERDFSERVEFFVAVHSEDLTQLKRLLTLNRSLVHLTSTFHSDPHGYYWPGGGTVLHYAAGTGNRALVELCLNHGADINMQPTRGAETPLHVAVQMLQPAMLDFLVVRGANVNLRNSSEQTPIFWAVLQNVPTLVQKLIAAGADLTQRDRYGYTPADWAKHCDYQDLSTLLDRPDLSAAVTSTLEFSIPLLNAHGDSWERAGPSLQDLLQRVRPPRAMSPQEGPTPLTTGIKIIDLFAPLIRGGRNALFSSLTGAGKMVTLAQLAYRMAALHDSYIVNLGVERGVYTARNMQLYWRESMFDRQLMDGRIINIFVQQGQGATDALTAAKTATALAKSICNQGHDVLLIVDAVLGTYPDVIPALEANPVTNAATSGVDPITTILYWGDYTAGSEPTPYDTLDTVLTLERWRAAHRLHPAIDPLHSYSRLLTPAVVGEEHWTVVAAAQRLLRRYADLALIEEERGEDGLAQLTDPAAVQDARRARRLHRFLTQPFFGTEMYTGKLGATVSVADAIVGCQAILNGECDELSDEALLYIGTLAEAVDQ